MTQEEEHARIKERITLKDALDLKPVRDTLWRLIGLGGVYTRRGPQPLDVSNFLAGKRELALELIELIDETSPDHWILMQNENREENNDD